MSGPLERQDLRDLATVERFAQSVLRQCEYLRRNGGTDTIRWGLIAGEAWSAWRCAAKADRRAARANDWTIFRWFMPRGYGAPGSHG